jgi:hypothetical protein
MCYAKPRTGHPGEKFKILYQFIIPLNGKDKKEIIR